jgi:ribosomal protein S18 acetylase RimI-like enzyme
MTIRNFKIADYYSVYALWRRSPNMGLNDIDDSREGIGRYLRRNPKTSFVAEIDGVIVGVIMGGHDGRRGYIHHTCVAGEFRRRGIGAMLVEAVLDALKDEKISKVALVVFLRNESGNLFWERMGFTARPDLDYRNRALVELQRIDT